jgi:very-short-patch-repair endonuclease
MKCHCCGNELTLKQEKYCSRQCQKVQTGRDNSARRLGKKYEEIYEDAANMREVRREQLLSEYRNGKRTAPWKGENLSVAHRENIAKNNAKFWLGRTKPDYVRTKIRRSVADYVASKLAQEGSFIHQGKNEKRLLDLQEVKDNCKILRQHHIKEAGYFADGYCPETNTVYEIYESRHLHHVEHDLKRQAEIQNSLNCNFHVIWDL